MSIVTSAVWRGKKTQQLLQFNSFILQRFRPHFTLLTNVPPEELSKTCQEFEKIFSRKVLKRTIRVEELAIMSRPMPDAPWVIEDEVGLG